MTTIAVTIRDEHQKFIEDAVKSGRYVSENEVVADAIAELKAREELRQSRMAELSDAVRIGLDELDRGEGLEWDLEAVKAKGRELLAARHGNP
jgi:antitoxin ParD1/3/4